MSVLDNLIGAFSPGWKAARLRSRAMIRAYEAVMPTRTHKARRETRSPNQLTQYGGRSLREQARFLDSNHDLVIGALDKLEERIIGAKGIIVEPQPLTRAGELDKSLADQIRSAWAEWSVSPDVTGQYTRPVLERLLLRTWLRDGEVFARVFVGKGAGLKKERGIPFWIEALEPDFVPDNLTAPDQGVVQGIELDAWKRPLRYMVYHSLPSEGMSAGLYDKVDAGQMLHLKFTRRLHQLRGVTLLSGAIIRIADLKDYEDSERISARIAASLGMYVIKGDALSYDDKAAEDGPRELDFEPGMLFDGLRPGEKVGMVKSDRPNTGLESFRMGQLRAIAAGTRVSFSSISRNYDGTYSAQRQELVEAQEGYGILQDAFIAQVTRPLYRRWLNAAISTGAIRVPADIDTDTLYNAVYSGPVMPWIDPLKEANAWRVMIRGGSATESEWIRARGGNPAEVKRRRKAEIDDNRAQALVFDTDPANDKGAAHADNNDDNTTTESGRNREGRGR